MSELRQDPITHDWVIVNPERAKRPHDGGLCPFCPGNESLMPEETDRIEDAQGRWIVRAAPNRYPTLDAERRAAVRYSEVPEGWRRLPAYGQHEVIIESPQHDATLAALPVERLRDVLEIYVRRFRVLAALTGVARHIVLFKNQGRRAGTSLAHPHAQIVATPVVSPEVRMRTQEEVAIFDSTGHCGMCHVAQRELGSGERVVHRSAHFVTLAPYASCVPWQIQIVPLRHAPSFAEVKSAELDDLAAHLHAVLGALHAELVDPHYNLVVMTPPLDQVHRLANHWFIDVQPRTTLAAGFELGSRIVVNVQTPETAAKALRAKLPQT
jgi:UDPglucose--hexose-1-phosphate uridylyltransferase